MVRITKGSPGRGMWWRQLQVGRLVLSAGYCDGWFDVTLQLGVRCWSASVACGVKFDAWRSESASPSDVSSKAQ